MGRDRRAEEPPADLADLISIAQIATRRPLKQAETRRSTEFRHFDELLSTPRGGLTMAALDACKDDEGLLVTLWWEHVKRMKITVSATPPLRRRSRGVASRSARRRQTALPARPTRAIGALCTACGSILPVGAICGCSTVENVGRPGA